MPQIFEHFEKLDTQAERVICFGNFDGIHLGHQSVLNKCLEIGEERSIRSCVFTFDPHPRRFFAKDPNLKLLMTREDKQIFLQAMGFEEILFQNFDSSFASIEANDFVQILEKDLKAEVVLFGRDFQFGKKARGDRSSFENSGIEVCEMDDLLMESRTVSSGAIRECVGSGDLELARQLLDYPYFVSGSVVKGDQIGRELGFPTANLMTKNELPPKNGVYISLFEDVLSKEVYLSVSNLGYRPSIDGQELRLESHLLNFSGDFYGKTSRVFFLRRLRDETRFNSKAELSDQIQKDLEAAQQYFQNQCPHSFPHKKLTNSTERDKLLGFFSKIFYR